MVNSKPSKTARDEIEVGKRGGGSKGKGGRDGEGKDGRKKRGGKERGMSLGGEGRRRER